MAESKIETLKMCECKGDDCKPQPCPGKVVYHQDPEYDYESYVCQCDHCGNKFKTSDKPSKCYKQVCKTCGGDADFPI